MGYRKYVCACEREREYACDSVGECVHMKQEKERMCMSGILYVKESELVHARGDKVWETDYI